MRNHLTAESFGEAMAALAALRPTVDSFFDAVLVNVDDVAVRANRLKILTLLRDAVDTIADFAAIEDTDA